MKQKQLKLRSLCISAAASALLPVASALFFSPVSLDALIHGLMIPLGRLICFITVGLVAGQLIEGFGWTRQVAVLARPFFRFSRMGDQCSAAFTTAFFSGTAANAMLAEFLTRKKSPGFSCFYLIISTSSLLFFFTFPPRCSLYCP
jgi:hypothetical protein